MTLKSERVKQWRKNTKAKMIAAMGNQCCICGYNKCSKSMDFHHLNPEEKEHSFGKIMAHPTKWENIALELKKCVLVCSNCHGEIHAGITTIPKNAPRFNPNKTNDNDNISLCPICGKPKPSYISTCSRKCAAKKSRTVNWEKINILSLKNNGMALDQIGELIGVSEESVKKRMNKLLKNIK